MTSEVADGWRAAAVAAYAGSTHTKLVLRAAAVLRHLHGPADPEKDLRCPTCRDSRGRRVAWPCRTYIEVSRALGADPGPALRVAELTGAKLPPLLDLDELEAAQRRESHAAEAGTHDGL